MLRYGIIGTSWISEAYYRGAALTGDWALTAVCSRDPAHAADFAARIGQDVPCFATPAAMADSGLIDAAYIASPNALHAPQSRVFLEKGLSVICEKPVVVRPEEWEENRRIAEETGAVYLEALIGQHLPERQALKDALAAIGRISMARFDFCQHSSRYDRLMAGELPNIFNPALAAGCLMDLGVYCVYPALDLFGLPTGIQATGVRLPSGADACGTAVLEYPTHPAVLTYSKIGQSRANSEIIGDKGTILIPSISTLVNMELVLLDGTRRKLSGAPTRFEEMSREAADFARYIRGDRAGYAEDQRLSLEVSRVMAEIRRQIGLAY